MTQSVTPKKRKKSNGGLALFLIVLLAGGAWGVTQWMDDGVDPALDIQGAPVELGPLRISVVERGHLKAADSVTLKSEIEGRATILWLIEEGVEVQPGELLAELDTSSLDSRKVQQEIKVQNTHANFVKAQQSHAIQISQNLSDNAQAERLLEFARIDLTKFVEGDMPQELQKKDEDIMLADEQLLLAQQDLKWSQELHSRGFLEQSELDTDKITETRTLVSLNQAKRAKKLYENYEIPRKRKELEAEVEERVREAERVQLQATARIADFEANLKTSEATYGLEESELQKLLEQIGKASIRAPIGGMVVYASEDSGRYGDEQPMAEGTEVRERQGIVTIPSSEGYMVEASLHESVIEKVTLGMPCLVTVDALRETFPGQVAYKAVLPDQQSRWMNPDLRVYRTEIKLLKQDPRLRPGMSCSLEVLVDDLKDVLYVPVQSIFLDAGLPVCLMAGTRPTEKRSVTLGQSNGKWVEVQTGVEQGEIVLMAQPADVRLNPASEGDSEPTDFPDQGDLKPPSGDKRPDGGKGPGKGKGDGKQTGWTKSGTETAAAPGGEADAVAASGTAGADSETSPAETSPAKTSPTKTSPTETTPTETGATVERSGSQ
jgi:HlyD family secretion protein